MYHHYSPTRGGAFIPSQRLNVHQPRMFTFGQPVAQSQTVTAIPTSVPRQTPAESPGGAAAAGAAQEQPKSYALPSRNTTMSALGPMPQMSPHALPGRGATSSALVAPSYDPQQAVYAHHHPMQSPSAAAAGAHALPGRRLGSAVVAPIFTGSIHVQSTPHKHGAEFVYPPTPQAAQPVGESSTPAGASAGAASSTTTAAPTPSSAPVPGPPVVPVLTELPPPAAHTQSAPPSTRSEASGKPRMVKMQYMEPQVIKVRGWTQEVVKQKEKISVEEPQTQEKHTQLKKPRAVTEKGTVTRFTTKTVRKTIQEIVPVTEKVKIMVPKTRLATRKVKTVESHVDRVLIETPAVRKESVNYRAFKPSTRTESLQRAVTKTVTKQMLAPVTRKNETTGEVETVLESKEVSFPVTEHQRETVTLTTPVVSYETCNIEEVHLEGKMVDCKADRIVEKEISYMETVLEETEVTVTTYRIEEREIEYEEVVEETVEVDLEHTEFDLEDYSYMHTSMVPTEVEAEVERVQLKELEFEQSKLIRAEIEVPVTEELLQQGRIPASALPGNPSMIWTVLSSPNVGVPIGASFYR